MCIRDSSSTIDDSDVERIKRDFYAGEPHELVEKRIKPAVIRRRAVRTPADELKEQLQPEEAPDKTIPQKVAPVEPPREVEKPPEAKTPKPAAVTPPVKTPPPKPTVPETPPAAQVKKIEPILKIVPSPPPPPRKEPPRPKPVEPPPVSKKEEPAPPKPVTEEKPVEKVVPPVKTAPLPPTAVVPPVKQDMPLRRPEEPPPVKPTPITPPPPKKPVKPPELRIVKETPVPVAKKPTRWEVERDKRKGKKPVEVIITEPGPSKKKLFAKKGADRRDRFEDLEREDRPTRWREEKKTATKMLKTVITTPKAIKRRIKVGETITVGDLAKKMGVKAGEVINKLMGLGLMVTINQAVDFDTATLIAADFNYQVEPAGFDYEETTTTADQEPRNLKPRAPVVTIMGHVDHGKTSLLDAIRQTNVIDGEAGGITQAIGAYHVNINDRDIVFLDTPGHEAFTAMRARGAQVTDIVVLVVAADDGVMDQTVEAINHSRAAGVPILVAINKIDKPNADPERIKQALTEYNLVPEEWGGDTIYCEVSAKQKINIEELLEMILLQADILELKADPDRPARGVVIEAKLDKGRGPVATVLIQEGTLREGDTFVCKTEYGRVRAMINDKGVRVKEVGPSLPVEVIGFSRVPQVSAEFLVVEDERKARNIADYWMRKEREKELSATSKITLEQLYARIKEGVKDFNVIVKGDVQGSIEALTEALNKLSTADVKLKIIHSSTGAITETDVMLASSANAIIIGFNVRPDGRVAEVAEQEGVEIKLYDVIYNVIADVKAAMEGLLEPEYREVVLGRAEVRQLFRVPKVGTVAGCYVTSGKIQRNANLKLVRDGIVVHDGRIASLKRLKDDAREVLAGFECGIAIENFNDLREGDVIEAYINEKVERKL
ncbi:MAG: translation initiation factor IF-2, partial [Syntrophales bacterium]|nr:translation initiation factor IF-2 [Syntrophales bacterium]